MPAPKKPEPPRPTAKPAPQGIGWQEPDRKKFVNPWNNRPLLDYFLALLRVHGYIRLLGLPQLKDNPDIPIESLFVEPELSDSLIAPDQPVKDWPKRQTVTDALVQHPRLVVLGDPGMGKTSLLQWLVTQFCRSGPSRLQERLGLLVPLPFILRDLTLTQELDWKKLLDLFLAQPVAEKLRGERDLVENLLASGQAMVLMDGLDEVASTEVMLTLRQAAWHGMEVYSRCRWLLTSRVVGYHRLPFHVHEVSSAFCASKDDVGRLVAEILGDLELGESIEITPADVTGLTARRLASGLRAATLCLAPFNDRQVASLVQNWYAEREADPSRRSESAAELLANIREHPGTEKLARIPNLLTMMALIHRVRAKLPQGRVNLYNDIAQAYLQTIDEFRGLPVLPYTLAQKKQWLARIAFEIQFKRANPSRTVRSSADESIVIARDQVLEWLADSLRDAEPGNTRAAAEEFLDYLQRRTGLFLERSPGAWSFLHLSFQEYFAACFLAEEVTGPEWLSPSYNREGCRPSDLRACTQVAKWKETLVFLFEMLGQERPRWADSVARQVFQDTFRKPLESMEVRGVRQNQDVTLAAELSVDVYSGLSVGLRREIWNLVWCCSLTNSIFPGNPSADALFAGPPQYVEGVWNALRQAAEARTGRELDLSFCKRLVDISPLQAVTGLEALEIHGTLARRGLEKLATLPRLRRLSISWPGEWEHPLEIGALKSLTILSMLLTAKVRSLREIPLPASLEVLRLYDYSSLEDLSAGTPLDALRELRLIGCKALVDLTPLVEFRALEAVVLESCDSLESLDPLTGCQRLKRIVVGHCPNLRGIPSALVSKVKRSG